MTAVNDIQDLDTVDQVGHGAECFCGLCRPQIVDVPDSVVAVIPVEQAASEILAHFGSRIALLKY